MIIDNTISTRVSIDVGSNRADIANCWGPTAWLTEMPPYSGSLLGRGWGLRWVPPAASVAHNECKPPRQDETKARQDRDKIRPERKPIHGARLMSGPCAQPISNSAGQRDNLLFFVSRVLTMRQRCIRYSLATNRQPPSSRYY